MSYPDFNAIKSFYDMKLWTKDMVSEGVRCKAITVDQYKTITGEEYTAPVAATTDTTQTPA